MSGLFQYHGRAYEIRECKVESGVVLVMIMCLLHTEEGMRYVVRSRMLGDVYV